MRGPDAKDVLIGQLRAEVAQRDAIIAERDAVIAQRDALITLLSAQLGEQQAQLESREAELAEAKQRFAELLAVLHRHFNAPPKKESEETLLSKKKRPPRSLRKRGGQPGHPGHARALLPPDKVSKVVELLPPHCRRCNRPLFGQDATPMLHQVVEVPPLCPSVTEYRLHQLRCPSCGQKTRAALPEGVPPSDFGPRLCALLSILSGKYHLSKRMVEEMLHDFLGVRLSLGQVCKLEQTVSSALAVPCAKAQASLPQAAVVYQDETSWPIKNQKAWLWVTVTALVTVFLIDKSRGKKVCQHLLGQDFQGTLVSDRWCAYQWVGDDKRQFCWSHLLQDFGELVDAGGDGARLGKALVQQARRLFRTWHRIRDQTLPFSRLEKKMQPVRRAVHALLEEGALYYSGKAKTLCQQLLLHEPTLWHFTKTPGVEPTNNCAERAQRQAVLWRNSSFGTQSEAGSVFVARILTAIATLRQQGRNVLEYLAAACQALFAHQPAPALLLSST